MQLQLFQSPWDKIEIVLVSSIQYNLFIPQDHKGSFPNLFMMKDSNISADKNQNTTQNKRNL